MDVSPPRLGTFTKRCAIYARKSIENGLERDFNSLEAQCALCSAYITSQQHRGWVEIEKPYIDAGQSGATIDRPGLQTLIADVEAGRIDIIVIYKLDRLSRSLLDFVRLIALLERNSVSFVCITQNFDTGDSLGRLIMNVLLTFAQFERELTSDRIRDKRRAMAMNGIWVGPHAPYGYDYVGKRLVANKTEAAHVRFMFNRYLELGSMSALWRECAAKNLLTKVRARRSGEVVGGLPVTRGSIRFILCNPVYKGMVVHRGTQFPGRHQPLVGERLWNAVEQLRLNNPSERSPLAPPDLLPPVVFDAFGRRMAMVRKYRGGACERYYYSYSTAWGRVHRVPRLRAHAGELEKLTIAALSAFYADREQVRSVLLVAGRRGCNLDRMTAGCERAARRVNELNADQLIEVLAAIVARAELTTDRVKLVLRVAELERFLTWDGLLLFTAQKSTDRSEATHLLDVPASAVRLSRRLRLPIGPRDAGAAARPSRKLFSLIKRVRQAQHLVDTERDQEVAALAQRMSCSIGHFMKLLRLNYLAPDIVTAILDGTQPPALTRRTLIDANLPTDWPTQRKLFGFPEQPPLRTGERY
jgi:site-specific DNA recombinase